MATGMMLSDVGAVPSTSDPQVTALLEGSFHRFDQWKSGREVNRRSKLMRLRLTLDHLLTQLLGARDYAGAAQVLSVLYHRFTLIPSRCVQASLEILRRHPQHHKEELMQFYKSALQNDRLDQVMVCKEMFMLHIVSGDYYEAYHLFKDEMQELDVHHDAHLQGTFGMVCYWLLFIESEELRRKFTQENSSNYTMPGDDDDDDDISEGWNPFSTPCRGQQSQNRPAMVDSSVLELVESRYMYKTAIGVHILFQEATTALRRAIAVSPDSTVFLEFYVQLLTLAGDVDRACDLLEHFYHLNPTDPHAARLLASYLQSHFPEAMDAQVDICARWIQNDPLSSEALKILMKQSELGLVSHERLLVLLAGVTDVIGGDLHLTQSPETVVRLYRAFGEIVHACVGEESNDTGARAALTNIRESRKWWIKSYFSRPATSDQVIAYTSSNESFHEVALLKAVLAYQLFDNDGLIIGRAIHAVGLAGTSAPNSVYMKRFRSVFSAEIANTLLLPTTTPDASRRDAKRSTKAQPSVPVLSRSLLVKDTGHAKRSRAEVTRTEDDQAVVDQALVRALEEAVRVDLADGQPNQMPGKRSFETMISGIVSSNGERTVSVPLYVELLEELLYKRTKAWSPHMQVQLNGYLRDAGATIPSWLEVQEAFQYFQERWLTNETRFDHPGLLLRYEAFLVRFMRKRAKSSQYWLRGISPIDVRDALHEMKLHVSRSQVHFPEFEETAKWMQIKAPHFIRARRRLLRDYMLAMRFVAYESDHVETRDLVYAAMRVAAKNYHSDLLAVGDLKRQAKIVLVNRYAYVVRNMKPSYRQFLESYVRVGQVYDPREVFGALKRRFVRMKRVQLGDVKAMLWLKQWELENLGSYDTLIKDKSDDDL